MSTQRARELLDRFGSDLRHELVAVQAALDELAQRAEAAESFVGGRPFDADRFYRALLRELERHLQDPSATAEGFGVIAKRVALEHGISAAARTPVPRRTRKGHQRALDWEHDQVVRPIIPQPDRATDQPGERRRPTVGTGGPSMPNPDETEVRRGNAS